MFKVGDVGVVEFNDGTKEKATVIAVYSYLDGVKLMVVLVHAIFEWVLDGVPISGTKYYKEVCYLTFTKSE